MFRPVIVPPTTPSTIIFPFNAAAKKFDTSFYTSDLTNGKLSQDDVNKFVSKLEIARKPTTKKTNALICWYSVIAFLCMSGIVAFDLTIGINKPDLIPIFTIGMVILCLGIGLLFIMSAKSLGKQAKRQSQNIIDQHQPDFQLKGLTWSLPEHYPRWIELHKDYHNDNIKIQTHYIPPDVQ